MTKTILANPVFSPQQTLQLRLKLQYNTLSNTIQQKTAKTWRRTAFVLHASPSPDTVP